MGIGSDIDVRGEIGKACMHGPIVAGEKKILVLKWKH